MDREKYPFLFLTLIQAEYTLEEKEQEVRQNLDSRVEELEVDITTDLILDLRINFPI